MLPTFNKNTRSSDQDTSTASTNKSSTTGENRTDNDDENDDYVSLANLSDDNGELPKDLEHHGADIQEEEHGESEGEGEDNDEDEDEDVYNTDNANLAALVAEQIQELGILPSFGGAGFGMVPSFLQENAEIQQMRQDIRNDLESEDGVQFDIDVDTDSLGSSEGSMEDSANNDNIPQGIYSDDIMDAHGGLRGSHSNDRSSTRGTKLSRHSSVATGRSNSTRKSKNSGKQKNKNKKTVNNKSPFGKLGILGALLKLHRETPVENSGPSASTDMELENLIHEEENENENEKDQYDHEHAKLHDNKQSTTNPNKKKYKTRVGNAVMNGVEDGKEFLPNFKSMRPKVKKGAKLNKLMNMNPVRIPPKSVHEAKITVHITNLLQKHRFIIRLCKAFMQYGAPTHRLEEYMKMTSKVLEIDGQYLYLPGCMVISFGDVTTRTSELQMIKCNEGVNLWKLHKVHQIYKNVIHDLVSVEEANNEIDIILSEPDVFSTKWTVFFYALASAIITPLAFDGWWINLPISFVVGGTVGLFKFFLSPKTQLYSNSFEISSTIVVSFLGRALGSIPNSNICFGAVVQGSLALILPGYIILCGSLELQNKSLVAGSVRMFYSIIYSLFLSFGITLGSALWGWIYRDATNETTCLKNTNAYFKLLFVPAYTVLIALVNQANWRQLPVMFIISCTGYVVSYFSGLHFQNATEFNSSLAAFVIGILGNLYSRVYKGLAVSAILPAIFVQVPSGIASKSSLLTGVETANKIVNTTGKVVSETTTTNSLSFGMTMTQVSIGITVGLFASTLIVYPLGKKKTAIFSL